MINSETPYVSNSMIKKTPAIRYAMLLIIYLFIIYHLLHTMYYVLCTMYYVLCNVDTASSWPWLLSMCSELSGH